jgi:hypothetical protein
MEFARSINQPVNTVHVLYGLAKEYHGVGGHVLNKYCGLSHGLIGSYVEGGFAKHMIAEESVFDLLERSLKVAANLGHNYIGTEHLILAILADENCLGCKFLKMLNHNCDAIEEELMHLLGLGGYTRSYVEDDGEFWFLHWTDWLKSEEILHTHEWIRGNKDADFAMTCPGAGVGFIIRKTDEPSTTKYRKIEGVKVAEVFCQRDQVDLVRLLVVNFLVAMMSFQEE